MSIWIRAILYMLLIGGGWLVVIPAAILYFEQERTLQLVFASPPRFAAGVTLFMLGCLLALWAGNALIRRGRGTPFPLDPTTMLVTDGPYAWVRNPQAISMMLMVGGEVLAVHSVWLWVMLPATMVYLELLVGPIEHRQMIRDFGEDYQRYASRVMKWIPRWPR